MTRKLTLMEHTALTFLTAGRAATQNIAHACRIGKSETARTMLRTLERSSYVEGIRTRHGHIYWWEITDAGRKAIAP